MQLESKIFTKAQPNFAKLKSYGFQHKNNNYHFQKNFHKDAFQAQVTISNKGRITGKVIDLDLNDEYLPIHSKQSGKFVNQIRSEYISILKDIKKHCFTLLPFRSQQANRLANLIKKKFGDQPEFVFKRFPDYAVFRNPNSSKWYGLVMHIPQNRLTNLKKGRDNQKVDVLDIKIDPKLHDKLINHPGFYPGYHLNKINWITIILNGTVSDEKIMQILSKSRQISPNNKYWLIPANPKYYDIIHAFDNTDQIIWKQSTNVQPHDLIFMYAAAPVSAIMYECKVLETNIPYTYQSKGLKITHVMRIQLIKRYSSELFTFKKLTEYGIKAIRGPRHVPSKLLIKLKK